MQKLKIIECPRDAMQGIAQFIPTEVKAKYINQLLKVGFYSIDFGSFVSPKAIPQMKDTAEVLKLLELDETSSKLLAIVANQRGAEDAVSFDEIDYLGYPFSISETFQMRNTNSTIEKSLKRVEDIQNLCIQKNKKAVIYISMAFGNPYGDEWNADIVAEWTKKLAGMGIEIIALSDTVGVSNPSNIKELFTPLIKEFSKVEIGAHLHTRADSWQEKVEAAYESGCRRFDGAIKGFGGCPMAADTLTGNMPTEKMLEYFNKEKVELLLDQNEFKKAEKMAGEIFI